MCRNNQLIYIFNKYRNNYGIPKIAFHFRTCLSRLLFAYICLQMNLIYEKYNRINFNQFIRIDYECTIQSNQSFAKRLVR